MKVFKDRLGTQMAGSALAVGLSLAGCSSTPQHTNVLVFGVNTKVALDVSQDATSGVGVTLGYKRQEAVWMPLLPNQAKPGMDSGLQPSLCTMDGCPKFVGENGLDQTDTYSVLASFGSKLNGGIESQGKDAKVSGEIAQYFATGLAARLLAQYGGSGLVNTNGDAALSAKEKEAIRDIVSKSERELNDLLADIADANDATKVDKSKLDAAFAKPPGKDISATRQSNIKAATTMNELRVAVTAYSHDSVTKRMLDTLNTK